MDKRTLFDRILKEKKIKSVYQAIVSLQDGEVYGYEALSRIDMDNPGITTEELFHLAEKYNCVWELEALCRKGSLKHARKKLNNRKLFLNVDPNVIRDDKMKKDETQKYLEEYGINPEDIIFEVTERSSIEDQENFRDIINYYKKQNYHIAIDDFGEGYANLNRVCFMEPHYIKIDMTIVRNIDTDEIKRSMVETVVNFCENFNVKLIAEGIETKEELHTIIELGVHYGQGYYLQMPGEKIKDIESDVKNEIRRSRQSELEIFFQPSIFDSVYSICKRKETVDAQVPGLALYERIKADHDISEICVLRGEKVLGMITRNSLMERFAGQFGYGLNYRKPASEFLIDEVLIVDVDMSIENVSKSALGRTREHVYDAIIVTKDNKYFGIVTVKDLLEAAITIQVKRATEANPLTHLPGNRMIEDTVKKCIASDNAFSVAYFDLDNFKAYNDAYGFNNGDLMIKLLAKCIQECCHKRELIGHIGGDDFVVIAENWELEQICRSILELFGKRVWGLYNTIDRENGYIRAKNRNGFEDVFPIATVSIALMTNKEENFLDLAEFSNRLARIKKKAKKQEGNAIAMN